MAIMSVCTLMHDSGQVCVTIAAYVKVPYGSLITDTISYKSLQVSQDIYTSHAVETHSNIELSS